jgi:hypothetical protein
MERRQLRLLLLQSQVHPHAPQELKNHVCGRRADVTEPKPRPSVETSTMSLAYVHGIPVLYFPNMPQ